MPPPRLPDVHTCNKVSASCGGIEVRFQRSVNLHTAGRLMVISSVVFISPSHVVVASCTVRCIKPAVLVIEHQPSRSTRNGKRAAPRVVTLL